jgi:TetR/AcrR family transcriptional repressor of bet genes
MTQEKLSRTRQRQKLIDACISALYLHGPSRTTIDKVVSIADMSPGIVNFYFETKASLLLSALESLAVEFEERVLAPLTASRDQPVQALEKLIDLYLDPDIASPRKVSVWYSFWGEASSRREYHAICGKRDVAFADIVSDLVARLIAQSGASHLDADAIALGLIGALEMMWQEIAFQTEADVDRDSARRRCRAYLRSVFPQHFGAGPATGAPVASAFPAWALADEAVFAAKIADLFQTRAQFLSRPEARQAEPAA